LTEKSFTGIDLPSTAQKYVDRWFGEAWPYDHQLVQLATSAVRLDEGYCRRVAAYYDKAPLLAYDPAQRHRYDELKRQNRRQYQAIIDAGIEIEPWAGDGQPYENSRQLCEQVRETGRLYVYLTRSGHGRSAPTGFHPLREPSGVSAGGVEFCHNDLYRAVHDIFGHVMFGNGFGPQGEFLAAFCHMHMYSRDLHPVLFTEHIGQICWFFYGPHLMDETGTLPGRGDANYVPPARRPYPEQKIFSFPGRFLDEFMSMFQLEEEFR
jgi:hypothetical protein